MLKDRTELSEAVLSPAVGSLNLFRTWLLIEVVIKNPLFLMIKGIIMESKYGIQTHEWTYCRSDELCL